MSKADKLLKRVEFYEKMASSQKPETSDLLNKASLFERLALYSDRKSFLSAIAQGVPHVQDTEALIRNKVSELTNAIENFIATKSERQAYLNNLPGVPQAMDAAAKAIKRASSLGAQFNDETLPGLLQAARALSNIYNLKGAGSDAETAWRNSISPLAVQLGDLFEKQMKEVAQFRKDFGPNREMTGFQRGETPSEPAGETIELGETPAPGGRGLPPINPADQEAVFRFAIEEGGLAPNPERQNADGQLGPETRKALEAIKNYFAKRNPNNPRMTDAQAINAAKFQGR